MNDREYIGKRIAELRKEKGLSQVALSERTGIDLLAKIAAAMDCRVDFVNK